MFASRRGTLSYLAFYGANAILLPVLALYYQRSGMDGVRLGLLTALWPAGSLLGAWVLGAVADASRRHTLVLLASVIGAALTAQLIGIASSFATLVVSVSAFSLVGSCIAPMLDHGVINDLGVRQSLFGRVRLWGAVGWGLTGPLAGLLIDRWGLDVAFPAYGIGMLLLALTVVGLPLGGGRARPDVGAGFREVLRSRQWRTLLALLFVAATGATMIHHFLFLYLESIGGSPAVRGVALSVATISELLVFAFADRLSRRYRPLTLILFSMLASVIRLLLYSVIRDPVLALLPQLLHGPSFSLRLVASVSLARRLAPKGMEATAQSIVSATQMGAGGVASALVGGLLFRSLSPPAAFGWVGIVLSGLVLVFVVRRRAITVEETRQKT